MTHEGGIPRGNGTEIRSLPQSRSWRGAAPNRAGTPNFGGSIGGGDAGSGLTNAEQKNASIACGIDVADLPLRTRASFMALFAYAIDQRRVFMKQRNYVDFDD